MTSEQFEPTTAKILSLNQTWTNIDCGNEKIKVSSHLWRCVAVLHEMKLKFFEVVRRIDFFQELVFSLEVADFKVNMISSQELNVSVSFQSYFSGSTCLRVFGNRCKVLDSKTFQSQLLSKVFPSPKIFGFRFGRFAMVFSIQNSRFK